MPDYRGTGGTLAGLGEFLQSLANANDPDRAKRERLQQLLLQDPDLAAKLQDNPALLNSYAGNKPIFGSNKTQNLKDSIMKTPLTPEQIASKRRAGAIKTVASYNDQSNLNVAADAANSTDVGTSGLGVLVPQRRQTQAPTTDQQDIYNRSVGLPTTAEAQTQKLQQQHLQTQVDAEQKDLVEKDTLRKNATAARAYLTQNKLDPYSAFKVMNTLPPEVQTGLTSDKDLKDAIAQGMADEHFNKMLELQKTAQSSKHSEKDLTLAAEIASAKSIADKTGIPFDDVYMIQKTEGLLDKYQKSDFQPIPGDKDDRLAKAAKAISDFGGRYTVKQINQAKALYENKKNAILNELAQGKIKDLQVAEQTINEAGKNILGGLGIDPPVVQIDKSWLPFTKPKLSFVTGGDGRLGYSNDKVGKTNTSKTSEGDDLVKSLQAAIDNGSADYSATIADPRAASVRSKLRPPKKK